MTDVLLVVLTAVVAFFTYLVWLVYDRIAWLTGSMETYSALILRIEAARGVSGTPIEVIWWDPTIEPFPFTGAHGQPADLNRIYMGVPLRQRRQQRTLNQRLLSALSGRDP
ncbi:MAG TPA: hypothetical protein VJO34_11955 [Methylomirabilota bacterium]|nr:hypothetical protein [Methylomirabilota bacterium]